MKILSFDTESCDGNPKNCGLCSFGYCISDEQFNILEQDDILINPVAKKFNLGNYKQDKGIKLNYSESVFRSSPTLKVVYDKIKKIFNSVDCVVGYAPCNDINFLNYACKHYNLPCLEFEFIDVQELYRLQSGQIQTGLMSAINNYELNLKFALHRSDDDARATLLLLKEICLRQNTTLQGLLNYYKIKLGKTEKNGFYKCYSVSELKGENGLSVPIKAKKYLFEQFLANCRQVRGVLGGKTFCFANELVYGNLTLARQLVWWIYKNGGCYTYKKNKCEVLVATDNCDLTNFANGIYVTDFIKKYNVVLQDFNFNDVERLIKFYNKKTFTE